MYNCIYVVILKTNHRSKPPNRQIRNRQTETKVVPKTDKQAKREAHATPTPAAATGKRLCCDVSHQLAVCHSRLFQAEDMGSWAPTRQRLQSHWLSCRPPNVTRLLQPHLIGQKETTSVIANALAVLT